MKYHVIAIAALTFGFGALHAQDDEVEDTPLPPEEEQGDQEKEKRKKPGVDLEAAKEFRALDTNDDGAVSPEEFAESEIASRAEERDPEGNRVSEIFDKIDRNGDGEIGLFEYAESFEHRKTQIMERKVQARFDELDRNGDGFIGRKEFAASEIAEKARENGNAEKVSEVFDKIDLNDSGEIGAFEFAHAHENRDKPKMEPDTAKKFANLDAN
ncbi:MAG: EF-hand domain-containing protein, partial [Verrucomicrobiota bacterium]